MSLDLRTQLDQLSAQHVLVHSFDDLEHVPPTLHDIDVFRRQYGQQLTAVLRDFRKAPPGKIVLEGAHIYSGETPGAQHMAEARATGALAHVLQDHGYEDIESVVFVDYYHVYPGGRKPPEGSPVPQFDNAQYIRLLNGQGWDVNRLIEESRMVPLARELALSVGDTKITCSYLDAALSVVKKTTMGAGVIINVLPGFYRSEQRSMKRILRDVLPEHEIRVVNLFLQHQGTTATCGFATQE